MITHVVLIVQENRTFDNLFGGVAHPAIGGPQAYPKADSTYPPGVIEHMQPTTIDGDSGDNTHDSWACLNQTVPIPGDGRFSTRRWLEVSQHKIGPFVCSYKKRNYSYFRYVPQTQRGVYWEIAAKYGLGDRFFAATTSASFPPHQFIVAGDVSFMMPPERWIADQPGPQLGCFDATGSYTVPIVGPNFFSEYPTVTGPQGACYTRETYGDRLTAAGKSWTHFTTFLPAPPTPRPTPVPIRTGAAAAFPTPPPTLPPIHAFNGFTNISQWYKKTAPLPTEHFVRTTRILDSDVADNLPHFAWVKPPCIRQSDHPGAHGHNGQNWVGSVINSIGRSKSWQNTVIFVIWDDWGGLYDHVIPPVVDPAKRQLGRGVRIPFLVISPYLARPGGVVHTAGNPGSIMRFVDDLYSLQPLTAFDEDAPDLSGWFDFSQPPRAFVPIRGAEGAGRWTDAWCAGSSFTMVD
ncbi:MAG TPA: alkaline phosphatase family protein [Candidatus Elarobacter sp.]|nr:alkaline phosphatase family protein [Candidatus Elarobacter sp.]